jgi:hypothetical protein
LSSYQKQSLVISGARFQGLMWFVKDFCLTAHLEAMLARLSNVRPATANERLRGKAFAKLQNGPIISNKLPLVQLCLLSPLCWELSVQFLTYTTAPSASTHRKMGVSTRRHMSSTEEHTIATDKKVEVRQLSFEELAPELRNAIYHYALIKCEDESIDLVSGTLHDLALGLLIASPTIRREAMPIFFGANTFHIDCTEVDRDHLETRMRKLAVLNLGMIRRFRFIYCHRELEPPTHSRWLVTLEFLKSRCQERTSITSHSIPRSPFHTVSRVPDHACEASDAFSAVTYFLEDMVSYRRIRRLAMMDVLDIACFVNRCGDLHSRVLWQRNL